MSSVNVLGVGMHPWGKWGRSFVEYGVHAARAALADSGVAWNDVDLIVGGETVRNGYGGYVAGATFAQALGWNGARVATSYAACATGAQALDTARARILAGLSEVALVVGSDTTPKGFLAPIAGRALGRPGLAPVPAARNDEPGVLRALRPPPDGPVRRDRRGLRPGEGQERPARAGEPERPLPQGGQRRGRADQRGRVGPAAPARHLRHVRRRGRGGARESGVRKAARPGHPGADRRDLDGHADVPEHRARHAEPLDRRHHGGRPGGADVQGVDRARGLRGGGHRPVRREPRRGIRPVDGARAGLDRGPRTLQARRGRGAAARR